jgi:hypothetical protein
MTYGEALPILTSVPDGGERLASRPGRFTIAIEPLVPTGYEAGGKGEPVWTLWRTENFLALVRNLTPAVSIPAGLSRLFSSERTSNCYVESAGVLAARKTWKESTRVVSNFVSGCVRPSQINLLRPTEDNDGKGGCVD